MLGNLVEHALANMGHVRFLGMHYSPIVLALGVMFSLGRVSSGLWRHMSHKLSRAAQFVRDLADSYYQTCDHIHQQHHLFKLRRSARQYAYEQFVTTARPLVPPAKKFVQMQLPFRQEATGDSCFAVATGSSSTKRSASSGKTRSVNLKLFS